MKLFIFFLISCELIAYILLLLRYKLSFPGRFLGGFNFENSHSYDPIIGYRLLSNKKYNELSTGSQGFILNSSEAKEPNLTRKTNTRIYIFGGSTIAGSGATAPEKTIPAQIEIKLRALGKNVEVINFGVGGYCSVQELIKILETIKLSPDLVITYNGWNDYAYLFELGGYLSEEDFKKSPLSYQEVYLHFKKVVKRFNKIKSFYGFSFDPIHFLQSFYTVFFIKKILMRNGYMKRYSANLTSSVRDMQDKYHPDIREAATGYLNNLRAIKGICKEFNIKCISFLQPVVCTKALKSPNEEKLFKTRALLKGKRSKKIDEFYSLILRLAKNDDAQDAIVDLSQVFAGCDKEIFLDECHINDFGSEVVADKIVTLIKEII